MTRSDKPCLWPGCPALVATRYCRPHAAAVERLRPNVAIRRAYRTVRWRRLRAAVLAGSPFCVVCEARPGWLRGAHPSTDVDHVRPHHGNVALFWDPANLQALCAGCHAEKTRRGQ